MHVLCPLLLDVLMFRSCDSGLHVIFPVISEILKLEHQNLGSMSLSSVISSVNIGSLARGCMFSVFFGDTNLRSSKSREKSLQISNVEFI